MFILTVISLKISYMKKKIHLPIHQIVITCLYCEKQYQSASTSSQNISCSSCSSCNPFYTGTSAGVRVVGAVEKFRQRVEKFRQRESRAKTKRLN